jgi:hypothetical protein
VPQGGADTTGAPRRVGLVVAGTYAVIAFALTFPTWPARLRTHIPGDSGDALLNLWILRWVGHHATAGWSALWDAPIFSPHHDTLAYSESLIPVSVAHRLLSLLVRSDVMAFDLLYVAGWFASMWFTYLLARRLTVTTAGAFVAGLVYTLATPRLSQYGHFQLTFGFMVPVVLLCVLRLFERPTALRATVLGAVLAALILSTSYHGVSTLIVLAIVVPGLVLWWRPERLRATLLGLAIAAAVTAVLVAPVAARYASLERDPHFRRDPAPALAAHPSDFLRVSPDNHVLTEIEPLADLSLEAASVENRLFPGAVAAVLGVIGAVVLVRQLPRRLEQHPLPARALVLLIGAALVMLVLAFGDEVQIGDHSVWMPYAALRDLPGFAGIRATARFVAFPMLAVALLAGVGLDRVVREWSSRARLTAAIVMAALVVAETATAITFLRVPDRAGARAVNEELDGRPAGTVLELPMTSPADGAVWPYVEMPRQWLARIDGQRRVGGYSGFDPPGFEHQVDVLDTFPSRPALELLDELDVRYVVLRTAVPDPEGFESTMTDFDGVGRYSEEHARALLASLPREGIRSVERYGDAWLVELS